MQDTIYGHNKTLRFDPSGLEVPRIQSQLGEDEVFIEYHVSIDNGHGIYSNNEKGYAFYLDKDEVSLVEIENLQELYVNIEELSKMLHAPFHTQAEIDKYNVLSNKVYTKLLSKHLRDKIKGKKLTIAPDFYLHFLPFEALSAYPERTEFLIEQAEISYVYSHTFAETTLENNTTNKDMIAFAPHTFADTSLVTLQHTDTRIRSNPG